MTISFTQFLLMMVSYILIYLWVDNRFFNEANTVLGICLEIILGYILSIFFFIVTFCILYYLYKGYTTFIVGG